MTDTYYYICPVYTSGEGLVIVWVARGPPLVGGHYDILSLCGLDYTLYIGGGMFHRCPPIGFPIEAYRDPVGK